MPSNTSSGPSIGRYVGAAIIGLMVLSSSGYRSLRAPRTGLAPTGAVMIDRLENGSGSQVGVRYDNGNAAQSGSLTVNDNTTGSGRVKLGGSDGGAFCAPDEDGSGCICFAGSNGVAHVFAGVAADCAQ